VFHIEIVQAARQGKAWCGMMITGPRIIGLENFLLHAEQPHTGPVCEQCLGAVLSVFGAAIKKTNPRE
jgi:hypothetical protein